jgi:enoyl-CoA hydratase
MVEYEQRGRVAVITIRRPEARNAINPEVAHGIEDGLDRLEGEDAVWAGVLAGDGPVFCAGADLKVVAAGGMADLFTERGGFAGIAARTRSKPLIAAVDGPALAGGCEVALACDLIVASTQALFGLPEVKRSLVAAGGGLFRLPRLLPRNIALELILTGDPIDATRAHALGMVNQLVESGQAMAAALLLAERICQNAPLAVRESRKTVLAIADGDEETARQQSLAALARVMQTEDFAEGPRAFVEKRAPEWQAR